MSSSLPSVTEDARTPPSPLLTTTGASPPEVAPQAEPPVHADPEFLQQQIKLIQLCFGEHEFGVPLDSCDDIARARSLAASPASSSPAALYPPLQPFNAKQFVNAKLSHGVSLPVLCKDLDVFAAHVEDKMKRHVNTELHDAFIGASGRLVGMEAELQCAQKPLMATVKRVAAATNQINDVERTVQTKVQHACDAEKERVFDVTFLRGLLLYDALVDYLEEVEPALRKDLNPAGTAATTRPSGIADDNVNRGSHATPSRARQQEAGLLSPGASMVRTFSPARQSDDAVTRTAALQPDTLLCLERLTQISTQLTEVVALLPPLTHRDKDTAEMQQLADTATTETALLVQQAFARACFEFFEEPSGTATHQLRQIMNIYAQGHAESHFVTMFSDTVLRPFFDSVLSWKAATQARQSTHDMVRLLDDLNDHVTNKLAPLLLLVRRAFQGRVMPIAELLWPALCEGLIKKLVTLYDAAIPEAFHQRYVSAYRLYSRVESLCASREELDALRASPDVALWNHKWNTDVYMALRQADLHKALDAALKALTATPPTAAVSARPSPYFFAPMQELDLKISWLLSPEVFLFPCAPKMLREMVTAVELVLERLVATVSAPSEPPTPAPIVTQRLVQLLCDVAYLQREGTMHWLGQLTQAASPASAVGASMAAVVYLVRETLLTDCAALLRARVSQSIVAESLPALENARSVRLSYSHTKKPFPTQPSWYVADMLKPFDALARQTTEWGIDTSVRQPTLQDAGESMLKQFYVIAKDTLVAAKKMEESWEKLRKRKEATIGGASTEMEPATGEAGNVSAVPQARTTPDTASDRDKMTTQLFLDLKALVGELAKCGVACTKEGEDIPAAREAFDLLRRAEWIMGANIPEPADLETD